MKITVKAGDDQFITLDVDPEESVENVKALLEIETRGPLQQQKLLFNGNEITNGSRLRALGVGEGDLVMMVVNAAFSRSSNNDLSFYPDGSCLNPGAYRQHIQGDSDMMTQLLQTDPQLAEAILENDLNGIQYLLRYRYRQRSRIQCQQAEELKEIGVSSSAFERVVMLYVDMEVNGVPLKAFVESGAESTILSKSCAERCGLLGLLDRRYKGIAHGVGQAEILGRIHVAPIKIGEVFYPCSFMVLDAPNIEFLFGLDMLRKLECTIDLKENVLRVGGGEVSVSVPFLQEKDVPRHMSAIF